MSRRTTRRNAVHENIEGSVDFNALERIRGTSVRAPNPYKGKRKSGMDDCPICLKEYTENEEVVMLHGPSGPKHTMCVPCFEQYVQVGTPNKCPICRQSVFSVSSSFGRCVYLQRVKGKKSKNFKSSFGNSSKLFSLVKKSNIKDSEVKQVLALYNKARETNHIVLDKDSNTPLMVASHTNTVDALLRNNANENVNHRNNTGKTALFIQISKKTPNYNIMKNLITLGGADPNIIDDEGNSPLIFLIKKYKNPSKKIKENKPLEYILENTTAVLNHADLLAYADQIDAKPAIKIIKQFTPKEVVTGLEDLMGNLNVGVNSGDVFNLGGISEALRDSNINVNSKRRMSDPLNLSDLGDALPKVSKKKPFVMSDLGDALPKKKPFVMSDLEDALPKVSKKNPFVMSDLEDALPKVSKKKPFVMSDLGDALPKVQKKKRVKPSSPLDLSALAAALPEDDNKLFHPGKFPKRNPNNLRRSKRLQKRNMSELDKLMDKLAMFGRIKKPSDNKKRTKSIKSKSKRK